MISETRWLATLRLMILSMAVVGAGHSLGRSWLEWAGVALLFCAGAPYSGELRSALRKVRVGAVARYAAAALTIVGGLILSGLLVNSEPAPVMVTGTVVFISVLSLGAFLALRCAWIVGKSGGTRAFRMALMLRLHLEFAWAGLQQSFWAGRDARSQ